MKCRNCRNLIGEAIIDLGIAPHSNECLDPEANKANQIPTEASSVCKVWTSSDR